MPQLTSRVLDLAERSNGRLATLSTKTQGISDQLGLQSVAIFAVGSYARGDAHEHSDLDLFFINTARAPVANLVRYDLFSGLSGVLKQAGLEEFSNDGQFLQVHQMSQLFEHLGSLSDDHFNTSTARVLSLIESRPLANASALGLVRSAVADSYLRDYHDHETDFLPLFVVNDILRFWRHLCLAFEFRRHIPTGDQELKAKHALRNLKLKYYRLTSCFSAVAYLATFKDEFRRGMLLEMAEKSPFERLSEVVDLQENEVLNGLFEKVQDMYCDFVDFADRMKSEVIDELSAKGARAAEFERAREFGALFFELVYGALKDHRMLRYLLI